MNTFIKCSYTTDSVLVADISFILNLYYFGGFPSCMLHYFFVDVSVLLVVIISLFMVIIVISIQ